MESLRELFRYHTWAILHLLDHLMDLPAAALQEAAPGTYGSVLATLMHLVTAEQRYLSRLPTADPRVALPDAGESTLTDLRVPGVNGISTSDAAAEPGLQEQCPLLAGIEGAATLVLPHAEPQVIALVQQGRRGRQQFGGIIRVPDAHDPARTEHPPHLRERPSWLTQVKQHAIGIDGIEAGRGERQFVDRADLEAHGGDPRRRRAGTGLLDLPGLQVDAHRLARCDGRGEAQRDGPRPAAYIQQAHARVQMREQEGRFFRRRPSRQFRRKGRVVLVKVDLTGWGCGLVIHGHPPLTSSA